MQKASEKSASTSASSRESSGDSNSDQVDIKLCLSIKISKLPSGNY